MSQGNRPASGFVGVRNIAWQILLWIPVLGILVRATVFQRGRALGTFTVDLYGMVDIACLSVGLLVLLFDPRARKALMKYASTGLAWIVYYYLFCTLSALWSPVPDFTAYQGGKFVILTGLISVAVFYGGSFEQTERVVLLLLLPAIVLMFITSVAKSNMSSL